MISRGDSTVPSSSLSSSPSVADVSATGAECIKVLSVVVNVDSGKS